MKQGSTLFLRLVVVAMGLIALALCVFVLPAIHREWALEYPDIPGVRYPVIIGLAAAAALFFAALYQALKLLNYIDKNTAFSELSVKALRNIKYCGLVMSGLFLTAMPLMYYIAQQEDAPGIIVIGMFFVGAPLVIAVFSAVLQKLLRNAIHIKSENDLTV